MIDYDTMTPDKLARALQVGEGSAPVTLPDGDQFSVARDADGYVVTLDTHEGHGLYKRREERYEDEHALYGVLSALGPWGDQ